MTNILQQYFPMIRTRQELLALIQGDANLKQTFSEWTEEQQQEFLNMCTGMRGKKVLYDFMFKEILNPETAPERVESLLSSILGQEVRIMTVLPNDSTRIADETSLLIMDIVVQLEDGSIANVEIQKIGYAFPGQRSACYSADLLLRQYKRVRSQKEQEGQRFSYRDIQQVYTVVIFEQSPQVFHTYPGKYIHRFHQVSDTGLKLDLLQRYYFLPLDIYGKIHHNKDIGNKLEAWLTFLSIDEPEEIVSLIEKYPEFKPLYGHIYDMCRNVEGIMGLFSEELRMMDQNTVKLMIDELQEMLDGQKGTIAEQKEMIAEQEGTIEEQKGTIEEQKGTIEEQRGTIAEQEGAIEKLRTESEKKDAQMQEKDMKIQEQMKRIAELEEKLKGQKI